jgi:hypothetical protein
VDVKYFRKSHDEKSHRWRGAEVGDRKKREEEDEEVVVVVADNGVR